MRVIWKRSISVIVSFGLIVSTMSFMGDFSGGSTVRAVETETGNEVDTETEFTDSVSGFTYKLYMDDNQNVNAEITGYTGQDEDLVIPEKIGTEPEYKVAGIGDEAFKESSITHVTIPEGMEVMGYQSFAGCKSLKSIKIPSTIVKWNEVGNFINGAFMDCTALEALELTDGLTTLGQEAFHGCSALTSVKIPSTITFFPSYVFWGCSNLVEVELEEGITQMGYQAFRECTSLEEIKIPSTITQWSTVRANSIHANVYDCTPFYLCTSLKKVTFAEGLTTLYGFQGVRGCPLVTELDIPASVTDIEYAFANCEYLQKVTLHDGLESIGSNAFNGCSALKEVVIPDTVTTLGYRVFYQCSSLEKLILPSKLASIDNQITYNCNGLKAVYILAPSLSYKKINLAADGKYYCIAGSDTYKTYLENHPENTAEIPAVSGIAAEGYSAVYDGKSHDALVKVNGIFEGDSVAYHLSGTDNFQSDSPKIKEPGKYAVDIFVIRTAQDGAIQAGIVSVNAEIQKKESSIQLKNTEVTGGEYTMEVESYVGDEAAEITYSYYTDEALSASCEKPTKPGVYYVKAAVAESAFYMACESNVVTLTIKGNNQPTQKPAQTPDLENSPSPTPDGGTQVTSSPVPVASMTSAPKPTSKPQKTPEVKVKKVTVKKVKSPSKKKIEVQWKKVSGVTGYQIIVGLDKKFKKGKKTVTVKGASKTKAVVKNVKRKKSYYVKVRAYKNVNGVKKYGQWSSVGRVKVK